jgi:Holliday junction resolvase RusA-like endonuclease
VSGPVLAFRVAGLPIPQGSKSARVQGKRAVLYDDNAKTLEPWRKTVTTAAEAALPALWNPLDEPLRVVCMFAMPKPASAPVRRRTWPLGRGTGDVDKLARAVLDSLTVAKVWRDDARVVDLRAVKDYPGPGAGQPTPGVIVGVYRVAPPPAGELPLTTEGNPAP